MILSSFLNIYSQNWLRIALKSENSFCFYFIMLPAMKWRALSILLSAEPTHLIKSPPRCVAVLREAGLIFTLGGLVSRSFFDLKRPDLPKFLFVDKMADFGHFSSLIYILYHKNRLLSTPLEVYLDRLKLILINKNGHITIWTSHHETALHKTTKMTNRLFFV